MDNEDIPSASTRNSQRSIVRNFKFSTFDPKGEEWKYYLRRFELEIRLQGLSGEDAQSTEARRDLLLKCLSPEVYRLVDDHFDPTPVIDKSYDDVKDFLNDYYRPATSYLAERTKFNQCQRKPDQTVSQFLNELRSLAVGCKFGASLEEHLRDQFLSGLRNPAMQEELFQKFPEDNARLTDIERFALVIEAAQRQRQTMEQPSASSSINKVVKSKFAKPPVNPKPISRPNMVRSEVNPAKKCFRCGCDHRNARDKCPAINSTCRACGTKGHWATVCMKTGNATIPQRSNRNTRAANTNAVAPLSADNDDPHVQPINAVKDGGGDKRYMIDVIVNNHRVTMEYDTGALRSIIGQRSWKALGSPPLSPMENLGAYPNFTIPMLGETSVIVTIGGKTMQLPLAVTEGQGVPLFGKDWIVAFSLEPKCQYVKLQKPPGPNVASITQQKSTAQSAQSTKPDPEVAALINDYADVLSEQLGTIKGTKAVIRLHEDARPVVFKPRPIPFAIKGAAEAEINRLLNEGIIEPVDPTVTPIQWASPVVYVPKPNGHVRLCGDFKVTINKYIETAHIPHSTTIYNITMWIYV